MKRTNSREMQRYIQSISNWSHVCGICEENHVPIKGAKCLVCKGTLCDECGEEADMIIREHGVYLCSECHKSHEDCIDFVDAVFSLNI